MKRFDQAALFDRLAAVGRLDLDLMPPLGTAIAEFHAAAEHRDDHGGRAGMAWVVEGNAAGFAEYGAGFLEPSSCLRVTDETFRELDRQSALLEARREAGFVRQCHGDLHLRNIVLLDDRPTLFDGIEFNDRLSCTDVLYDLAFLLMDLWRRRLSRHANAVWNRYLTETGTADGVGLLPLFLSCRAAVRAKTSATAARLQGAGHSGELQELARQYLDLAEGLLHPPRAWLVAIGGLSGSGKSTLALGLAPSVGAVPGAIVLRSDEIRKQLLNVPALERLAPEGYAHEVSERVYATLAERARLAIREGHSAIVDATYTRPADRLAIERVAARESVPFVGFWLEAPTSTLIARAEQRHGDPSDANAEVIRMQRTQETGDIGWHRLDASGPHELALHSAVSYLQRHAP